RIVGVIRIFAGTGRDYRLRIGRHEFSKASHGHLVRVEAKVTHGRGVGLARVRRTVVASVERPCRDRVRRATIRSATRPTRCSQANARTRDASIRARVAARSCTAAVVVRKTSHALRGRTQVFALGDGGGTRGTARAAGGVALAHRANSRSGTLLVALARGIRRGIITVRNSDIRSDGADFALSSGVRRLRRRVLADVSLLLVTRFARARIWLAHPRCAAKRTGGVGCLIVATPTSARSTRGVAGEREFVLAFLGGGR